MKKQIVALMLALSPAAFAQQSPPQAPQGEGFEQMKQQREAEHAQHLAQKLGLDASAAQRFQQVFDSFATQRKALFAQVKTANQTLRAAAQGDPSAGAQVNAAIAQLRTVRGQMVQLQDQLFDQLANGLDDAQRAKLALILERHAMHQRFGHSGHRGMAPGGAPWDRQPNGNP